MLSGVDIYPPLSMPLPEASPVVLLNHGLTGGSHESYVRNMVLNIAKPWSEGGLGGRVAVVNVSCASCMHLSHLFPN
jgi:predicted alpha/beta-fold hydrolase